MTLNPRLRWTPLVLSIQRWLTSRIKFNGNRQLRRCATSKLKANHAVPYLSTVPYLEATEINFLNKVFLSKYLRTFCIKILMKFSLKSVQSSHLKFHLIQIILPVVMVSFASKIKKAHKKLLIFLKVVFRSKLFYQRVLVRCVNLSIMFM